MMGPSKWTEERVRSVAVTCSSRAGMKRASPSAYKVARKTPGLLDEYFGHQNTYWNAVSVQQEASKYERKVDFRDGRVGAYEWAVSNGLIDTLFTSKRTYWNERRVVDEASLYSSVTAFRMGCPSGYAWASRKGLLRDLFDDAKSAWTEDAIRSVAALYTTKSEFHDGQCGAYDAARRLGILNTLGFTLGLRGFDSSKPMHIYISEIQLRDNTDGVMFGVTGRHPSERYGPRDKQFLHNCTAYLFLDGTQALSIERELKRRFLAKKITSKQCPLSRKTGGSGEIVTGVQRSIVEVALLDINSKFDGVEHW